MRRSVALALATLLCACTSMQWVKDDLSSDELRRDEQECRQAAWREASALYWFYRPVEPAFTPGPSGFMVWPSGAVVDPYGYQMLEENRLAQFCMESRGYKLVPAPKK